MSIQIRAPGRAQIIGFALSLALIVGAAGSAAAKTRVKKQHVTEPPAITAMLPAMPAQARFFTINQVLAKHDGRAVASPFQLAEAPALASDAAAPTLPAVSTEPFDLFTFRAPEGLLWTKWRGVERDIARDTELVAACRAEPSKCYSAPALRFIALVDAAAQRSTRDRLEGINQAVNTAITYTSDFARHGVADRWSSPLDSFASGRGDCEDYAIAKYVALRAAGTAPDDLRLLLVRDLATGEDHAVVAARDDGHWLVLDNRRMALMNTSDARLLPLFAIDDHGVKLFAAPYADAADAVTDVAPATADWGSDAAGGGSALPLLM